MSMLLRIFLLSMVLVSTAYAQTPAPEPATPLVNISGEQDALGQAIEALSIGDNSGLNPQQRLALIDKLGELRTANTMFKNNPDRNSLDIEGLTAILLIFSTPILAIYFSYLKKERVYKTIDKAIENGVEVPSSLLESVEKSKERPSALQRGLVWTGIGCGVLIAGTMISSINEASIGFIPLFIGLGYLLSAKMESNSDSAA